MLALVAEVLADPAEVAALVALVAAALADVPASVAEVAAADAELAADEALPAAASLEVTFSNVNEMNSISEAPPADRSNTGWNHVDPPVGTVRI